MPGNRRTFGPKKFIGANPPVTHARSGPVGKKRPVRTEPTIKGPKNKVEPIAIPMELAKSLSGKNTHERIRILATQTNATVEQISGYMGMHPVETRPLVEKFRK